ncbi:MAG: tRNA uridine-5-carboxymethylaminomethyl(34) synthesis GTPase MnmE [Muribaculaceae bacterium]|nr:tRNA uridine-5-carboxymethylaminomethyl(34) synthesis GTPase MnmE [Muribaculaceae bacterium]
MTKNDTICAISTPPGVGGIAVARVSGPEARDVVQRIWRGRRDVTSAQANTCLVGTVLDTCGEALDQAVATVFHAPHSFTGEDVVEVSVHGSRWVQQELVMSLLKAGARMAEAGEFSMRAFMSGRMDLTQAEAVADLIASTSRATQRLALRQMRGAFSDKIERLREELLELAALLELELDFSEEDVEFASRERLMELTAKVCDATARLADGFSAGRAIRDGVPVAIVGATNAGKSSILNALADDERAIVSDIHGTTRDVVEDLISIGDYTVRLKDTAGIRHTTDTIEQLGIERSRRALQEAAVILLVIDASNSEAPVPWDDILSAMAASPHTRLVVAANKSDLAGEICNTNIPAERAEVVLTSALTGRGIEELRSTLSSAISAALGTDADSGVLVSNARHYQALREASAAAARVLEALQAGIPGDLVAQDLRECLAALGSITGAITTPEILSTIFSRFCIGK